MMMNPRGQSGHLGALEWKQTPIVRPEAIPPIAIAPISGDTLFCIALASPTNLVAAVAREVASHPIVYFILFYFFSILHKRWIRLDYLRT